VASNHKSRVFLTSACVLLALACASGIISIVTINQLYPDNGGYTRNVLFIRPPPGSNAPGYFVIVDEFQPGKTIDLVFHSYGRLSFNASAGEATFDQNGTSMHMCFIGSPVAITNLTGKVYQYSINESVNYIKVRPLDAKACRLVTIITFGNATIANPPVVIDDLASRIGITVNGTDRFLFHPAIEQGTGTIDDGNATISGNYCAYRVNASGSLQWLLFANTTKVMFKGTILQNSLMSSSGFYNATASQLDIAGHGQGAPAPVATSTQFNSTLLTGRSHPYLLFDDSDLTDLRKKCNGTEPGPWQAWYSDIGTGSVLNDAFMGRIKQNQAWIDEAVGLMLGIDNITSGGTTFDWAHVQFIERSTMLYPYLLAYDMVYNNVSITNRTTIEQKLMPKLYALADGLASGDLPSNNWRPVCSTALGIGGLLFNNATWVNLAQVANDYYLNNRVRPNGPCYEGDDYGGYALGNAIVFYLALKHIGGYNYFTNPRFLKFLNYTVSSVTPLGWTPMFDDCAAKTNLAATASIATCQVNITSPILAANLQWYYDFCNTPWGDEVIRITSYSAPVAPLIPVVGNNGGFSYFDSGLACFRSGWKSDSTYLVISNKYFQQSHVHLDENSIEVYALGKKFLTNPGYPGWHQPGHDYVISTEASNTALLNGQGQLDVTSDGFSASLQNSVVDYLVSPSIKAYASPFRLLANPAFLVEIIGIIISLGGAGAIILYLHVKQFAELREESTVANRNASMNTFITLFKFDAMTLQHLDYRSKKVGIMPVFVLGLIASPGIIYFIEHLTDFTAFTINYINFAPSLVNMLESIAPDVKIAVYLLVPLACFLFIGLAMVFHALLLAMISRSDPGTRLDFKEARGIVGKAWMLQCVVMVLSIMGNIVFITPRFITGLHAAQIDTGNNISIGLLIENMLGDMVIYFLILGAISLTLQVLAIKVLDNRAKVFNKSRLGIKVSYYVGLLIIIAIFLAIALAAEILMFQVFNVIEIEHNPLQ